MKKAGNFLQTVEIKNYAGSIKVDVNDDINGLALFAASPDLLVALQGLLATIPFREDHNFEAIEAAYAAITKATGGAE